MENNYTNIFLKNFHCNDKNTINDIYNKQTDINLFNNKVIIHYDKFNHPLFLNYNYCLFCYEKKKTKFFSFFMDFW